MMMRSMFLKGCLCAVLEISGSLNAEITVDVFYISVLPFQTSANQNWEEREGGEEGKLIKQ